jgi:hypothetical protein
MSAQQTPPADNNDDDIDVDLLTPEERAAIDDGAPDESERLALQRLAADDDGDDDGDGADDDAPDGSTDDTPAPAPAQAPADEPPADEPEDAKPASKAAAPVYTADVPSDLKEQQDAIASQLTELRDKFKSGDLEVDDYETQREELLGKREELNKAVIKAEISQEMRQQDAQQAWQSAIERTFDSAAKPDGGGIDYRKDTAKAADLDLFVRRLGEDPANADKDMDWFLTEGHRRVLALHGISRTTPAPAPAATPAVPPSRKPPVGSVPPTLAQVPGSDGPGDVAGEFADLDALEGEALEDALSRLSPGQLEKYQRGR